MTKKSIIQKKLKSVMASVFNIKQREINEKSSTDNIKSWDSLKHINLVCALEDEFKVKFSNKEIGEMIKFKIISLILSQKHAGKK
jgi:acyl carrier protein|tara:strand:+ start:453 stop:707 length:255 start_codon:yes stop_codon:yes gene_type:complete